MAHNLEMHTEVMAALRRIIRAVDLHSKYLVQHYGLTGPQLMILQEVAHRKEAPVGELAQAVSLSHATVTDILGRLEKRGFVHRIRSDVDRRRVLVQLTQAGMDMLDETPPLLQESFIVEFTKLPDWEQTSILSALQRVASMMESGGVHSIPASKIKAAS